MRCGRSHGVRPANPACALLPLRGSPVSPAAQRLVRRREPPCGPPGPTRVSLLNLDAETTSESSSEPSLLQALVPGRSFRFGAPPKKGWLWGGCVQTPVYGTGSEYEMHVKPRGPFRVWPDALTLACVNFTAHGLAEAHDMPTGHRVLVTGDATTRRRNAPVRAGDDDVAPGSGRTCHRCLRARERPSTRSQQRGATSMCRRLRPGEISSSCRVSSQTFRSSRSLQSDCWQRSGVRQIRTAGFELTGGWRSRTLIAGGR
jgi:hypothetical protein